MFHQSLQQAGQGGQETLLRTACDYTRRPCTAVGDPQHGLVSCPGHIRGLAATDLQRKGAAIQASAPGSASAWEWGGTVASGLGTENQVKGGVRRGAVCAPWRMRKRRETGSLQRPRSGETSIPVEQGRRESWRPPQRSTEWRVLPRGRLGTRGAGGRLLLSCRAAATEQGQCSGKR